MTAIATYYKIRYISYDNSFYIYKMKWKKKKFWSLFWVKTSAKNRKRGTKKCEFNDSRMPHFSSLEFLPNHKAARKCQTNFVSGNNSWWSVEKLQSHYNTILAKVIWPCKFWKIWPIYVQNKLFNNYQNICRINF